MAEVAQSLPDGDLPFEQAHERIRQQLRKHRGGHDLLGADPSELGEDHRAMQRKLVRAMRLFRKRRSWRRIDWRRFDVIRADGELDEAEVVGFVDALAANPAAGVAFLPIEQAQHIEDGIRATHPSFRLRVLFLAREFMSRRQTPVA